MLVYIFSTPGGNDAKTNSSFTLLQRPLLHITFITMIPERDASLGEPIIKMMPVDPAVWFHST